MHVNRVALLSILGVALAGCASGPFAETRDPLSAGTAKLLLDKEKTNQQDVLEAFGGPNVVAGDGDGNETWTYDRMSYVASSKSGGGAGAAGGAWGSGAGGGLLWGSASKNTASSRTVTLYLYWKAGKLVDYKYRSASF